MGPRLKLPKYVRGFQDRHGKPRFYFRRKGYKSLPLPGLPWSPGVHEGIRGRDYRNAASRDRRAPNAAGHHQLARGGVLRLGSLAESLRRRRRRLAVA